jgi:hypothetical protein
VDIRLILQEEFVDKGGLFVDTVLEAGRFYKISHQHVKTQLVWSQTDREIYTLKLKQKTQNQNVF